jgi:DNA-binding response OmpR family regulator
LDSVSTVESQPTPLGVHNEILRIEKRADSIRIDNLEIRPAELELLADGRRVGLTVREFQTFLVLAERRDHVVTRPAIYARVWGGQMTPRDRSVDVCVRKIRRKLNECAPNWIYIHTHFGIGYRFAPERAGE